MPDAGRSAVHVVGHVDAFGVAGQRLNAAQLRLRKEWMISQAVLLRESFSEVPRRGGNRGVDGQDGDVGIHIIALIAGQL